MADPDLAQLKRQFGESTGLDPNLLAQPALGNFVQRRSRELGLAGEPEYYALAIKNPAEADRLVREVSVAETWFFRYPASFEVIKAHAARLLRRQHGQLRMLSIACATGEEPYGMAMAAAEAGWPLERITIDAIDRQESSLEFARKASYRPNSLRGEIPAWAKKWFRTSANRTHVDARIVATVRIARRDVVGQSLPAAREAYDIVCCRNLFIYLRAEARRKLLGDVVSVLAPDGLLLVGHAEMSIAPPAEFEPLGVQHAFALRRTTTKAAEALPSLPATRAAAPASLPALPATVQPPVKAARHVPAPNSSPQSDKTPAQSSNSRVAVTLDSARALADAGQLEAASAALDEIAASEPASPEIYSLLGSILLSLGQLESAKAALNKVLYMAPNHEAALLQLAIVCDRLGQGEQSARFRRRAARAHESAPTEPTSGTT